MAKRLPISAGLYKPRIGHCTGWCMNDGPAILATPTLIYSTHQLLVVWIILAHFHLCSLLDRYIVLEFWAVRRPMHVCCGSWWGRCMLFINILDSLTAPCLVYNIHVYSIGPVRPVWPMQWVDVHTMAGVWFIWTPSQRLLSSCTFLRMLMCPHLHFTHHIHKEAAKTSAFYILKSADPHFTDGLSLTFLDSLTALALSCIRPCIQYFQHSHLQVYTSDSVNV